MRILVIEDDPEVLAFVVKGLAEQGHTVDQAAEGKSGLLLATTEDYDVMVIDRMLPEIDGLTIVKSVRGAGKQTPMLILSALGEVDSRVEGLKAGGDDYLTKPFAFSELSARIEALARRAAPRAESETTLKVADLELNLLARTASRAGQAIELQPREFRLLEYLMRHAGQVVTRTMLLEHVWDYTFDPQTNVIDVHVSRLRAKIDKGFDSALIQTVRGAGYLIDAPD
ncbi:MAG: response regulator transcription factor [Gammaproteobacteria bacterium]